MITHINNYQNISCVQSGGAQQPAGSDPDREKPINVDDRVSISNQARELLKVETSKSSAVGDEPNLSESEKRQVDKLKKRDQEVKAHERAHMAAGSGLVMGGAGYTYERGADGNMYAVSGEVKIDTSNERDPEATIRKMQKVRRAALAPAQPSAQDRSVAAKASQIEAEARLELQKERSKTSGKADDQTETSPATIQTDPFQASAITTEIGHNLNVVA